MNFKKTATAVLAAGMLASMLSGCGEKTPAVSNTVQSGNVSQNEEVSQISMPESKVNSSANEPVKPDVPEYVLTIPDGTTEIPEGRFEDRDDITKVVVSDGVTYIGKRAFYGCKNLMEISLPDSLTSIGIEAFDSCPYVQISFKGKTYTTEKESQTEMINALRDNWREKLPENIVTIPDGTTVVRGYENQNITGVVISNSVTEIGDNAFWKCTGLTSVTIPNSVTEIGDNAFSYCNGLKTITLPDRLTYIGSSVFSGCTGLTSVTIPNSVTTIGRRVFQQCTGLKTVTLPDKLTCIDDGVFYGCTSLTSITIPDSVTKIGSKVFGECKNVEVTYKGKTYTYDNLQQLYNIINDQTI